MSGRLDVLVINYLASNELHRNMGNFSFEPAPFATSITAHRGQANAAAFGDFDSDGDYDVLVANYGGVNELYLFEHCPLPKARLGSSEGCVSIPTYARRSTNGDLTFECETHHVGSVIPTDCQVCPPGFVRELGMPACSKCTAGYAQLAGEGNACMACPSGKYSNFNGSVLCFDCPMGSHSPQPAAATCTPCGVGTFSAAPGSSVCSQCPVGGFCSSVGAASASMTCASASRTHEA